MVLGKADPPAAGSGGRPYRQPLPLGESDRGVPGAAGVDVRARDEHRVLRARKPRGQRPHRNRIGRRPAADRAPGRVATAPSSTSPTQSSIGIETNTGPRGGSAARWVARASAAGTSSARGGLVAPLHERMRHARRVAVGQVGLEGHHRAHLLARGDQQRRLVRLRVEDRPHRVPDPGRRVEVDQGRVSRRLGVPVGHAHRDRLLQPEDVAKSSGKSCKHRQLGRAGVAEHRSSSPARGTARRRPREQWSRRGQPIREGGSDAR